MSKKSTERRTRVEDLPTPERELESREQSHIRGGNLGLQTDQHPTTNDNTATHNRSVPRLPSPPKDESIKDQPVGS